MVKPVLELDQAGELRLKGAPVAVRLTNKEGRFWRTLLAARGGALSHDQILSDLYCHSADEPQPKIVQVYAAKIRRKLETLGAPGALRTIWGSGYALDVDRYEYHRPACVLEIEIPEGLAEELREAAFAHEKTANEFAVDLLRRGVKDAMEFY